MAVVPIGSAITPIPTSLPAASRPPGQSGAPFGDALSRLVGNVETSNTTANDAVGKMLDGSGDVHEAMIALQQADLALQLTVQVRNKLISAYQEIMRMPV
jgi:flagellar hook-basal body complex protein FliE